MKRPQIKGYMLSAGKGYNPEIVKQVLIVCLALICNTSVFSCTLWGCIGSCVADGGLLIAKNRDFDESSKTIVKVIAPQNGLKYLAMLAEGEKSGVKGGINEKGLVVFTATASSVNEECRGTGKGNVRTMLSECQSVDEVLKNPDKYLLGRVQFIIIGDRKELACIEVSPDNTIHVERKFNGTLAHTNHFLFGGFEKFNEKIGESSRVRYQRVGKLLDIKSPMTLRDMVRISDDKHDGRNNSIWREGNPGSSNRTLMNMSIYVPIDGNPVVSVKMCNKNEKERREELILDRKFWEQEGIVGFNAN